MRVPNLLLGPASRLTEQLEMVDLLHLDTATRTVGPWTPGRSGLLLDARQGVNRLTLEIERLRHRNRNPAAERLRHLRCNGGLHFDGSSIAHREVDRRVGTALSAHLALRCARGARRETLCIRDARKTLQARDSGKHRHNASNQHPPDPSTCAQPDPNRSRDESDERQQRSHEASAARRTSGPLPILNRTGHGDRRQSPSSRFVALALGALRLSLRALDAPLLLAHTATIGTDPCLAEVAGVRERVQRLLHPDGVLLGREVVAAAHPRWHEIGKPERHRQGEDETAAELHGVNIKRGGTYGLRLVRSV
ncbi:hypothetical protein ACFPRL_27665 [Pseudoclavibacter helvolus]